MSVATWAVTTGPVTAGTTRSVTTLLVTMGTTRAVATWSIAAVFARVAERSRLAVAGLCEEGPTGLRSGPGRAAGLRIARLRTWLCRLSIAEIRLMSSLSALRRGPRFLWHLVPAVTLIVLHLHHLRPCQR